MVKILESLYEEMYGPLDSEGKMKHLTELGQLLAKAVGRESAWTSHHLNALMMGYKNFRVTPDLIRAIDILLARLDGQSEAQARSREIMVLTTNGIEPGSIVFGHTTRCYCQLPVVFNHPCRKYCFEECRQRARRERKGKTRI